MQSWARCWPNPLLTFASGHTCTLLQTCYKSHYGRPCGAEVCAHIGLCWSAITSQRPTPTGGSKVSMGQWREDRIEAGRGELRPRVGEGSSSVLGCSKNSSRGLHHFLLSFLVLIFWHGAAHMRVSYFAGTSLSLPIAGVGFIQGKGMNVSLPQGVHWWPPVLGSMPQRPFLVQGRGCDWPAQIQPCWTWHI